MHLTKSSIVRVCGAAAALFLFGCGSSSTTGDPAAAFAGAWTFGSGTLQPMCTPLTIAPFDLMGDTMTIVRVDPTHVSTMLTGSGVMCDVNFTVAVSGQTCVVTVASGTTTIPVTININTWTLNVTGDTLSMSMAGSATASILTCAPTADG